MSNLLDVSLNICSPKNKYGLFRKMDTRT